MDVECITGACKMIDNEKEFNEVVNKFEPMPEFPMSVHDVECMRINAIISIAISLKRIADAMTKVPVMPELTQEQLEALKDDWQAGNIMFNQS